MANERRMRMTIVGKDETLPRGLQAGGKTCDGLGIYSFVGAPTAGKFCLVREDGKGVNQVTKMWKGAGAPMEPTKKVTLETAIYNLREVAAQIPGVSNVISMKGTWTGYIICTPTGPEIVLQRKFASYATLVLASALGKDKWSWAVKTSSKWFTTPTGTVDEGKGVATMKAAFNAAMKVFLKRIAESCTVKDTMLRAMKIGTVEKNKVTGKKTYKRSAAEPAVAKKTRKKVMKTLAAKPNTKAIALAKAKAAKKKAAKVKAAKAAAKRKAATAKKKAPKKAFELSKTLKKMVGTNVRTMKGANEGKVVAVIAKTLASTKKKPGKSSGPIIVIDVKGVSKHKRIRLFDKDGNRTIRKLAKGKQARTPAEIKAAAKKAPAKKEAKAKFIGPVRIKMAKRFTGLRKKRVEIKSGKGKRSRGVVVDIIVTEKTKKNPTLVISTPEGDFKKKALDRDKKLTVKKLSSKQKTDAKANRPLKRKKKTAKKKANGEGGMASMVGTPKKRKQSAVSDSDAAAYREKIKARMAKLKAARPAAG